MKAQYRSWAERREIIRAIIASTNTKGIEEFHLTESEEVYYRARTARVVAALARKSSGFKAYYALPTARPFVLVVAVSALTAAGAAFVAGYIIWHRQQQVEPPYPLLAACAAVTVAAIGWSVVGWIAHRNTVRQNTNNILFARFSQAPFGEALHRFHSKFGWTVSETVTSDMLTSLRLSTIEEDRRAAAAASYILNYFESIASGVIHGDLDKNIVTDNIRGLLCSYHDKCVPHIRTSNIVNPKTYENIIKLRTHYREP